MADSKKIIIIDRKSEVFQYLKNFIPLLGQFEVLQATNLIDALAKTNAYKPELLIYNLSLAQAHARDVFLAELRKKHANTRLLAICDKVEEAKKLDHFGIHDFIVRPFDLTDLSQKVEALLPTRKDGQSETEEARLLIADDEVEISKSLAEDFRNLGMRVYTAKDGREALEVFKEKICNLAIIDLKMPLLNGDGVVKEMEKSVAPPCPKDIILMTAALGESVPELQRQNNKLITKPIDVEALQKIIIQDCEKFNLERRTPA